MPDQPVPARPTRPCYRCGRSNWWLRGDEWLCAVCHPNPVVLRQQWDKTVVSEHDGYPD